MLRAKTIIRSVLPLVLIAAAAPAAIIGTNPPAQPLSTNRISALPQPVRSTWEKYWARSEEQSRANRAALAEEMRLHRVKKPLAPPAGRGPGGIALNKPAPWYSSAEAIRIAEIIVSFQTPAGGWSKNLNMTHHRRAPGELFAQGNLSRFNTPTDLDLPNDPNWNYVGTFDNGATTTQLRFLAKVISALEKDRSDLFRQSFLQGLEYIFAAQFPNGGWPQVWPLQGGYHDAVTFNDGAMTAILDLLFEVAGAKSEFDFVPAAIRQTTTASLNRGLECVLATQLVVDGHRTAWCQQYDALTLQPCSARNYEMPSLSSGESAGLMQFLMRLPQPDTNIIAAVDAAAAWFERVPIHEKSYKRVGDEGRLLVNTPGCGPIWSRYYDIPTNRPIFGDRDKTIHDSVADISRERREGYAWFTSEPKEALATYARWKQGL